MYLHRTVLFILEFFTQFILAWILGFNLFGMVLVLSKYLKLHPFLHYNRLKYLHFICKPIPHRWYFPLNIHMYYYITIYLLFVCMYTTTSIDMMARKLLPHLSPLSVASVRTSIAANFTWLSEVTSMGSTCILSDFKSFRDLAPSSVYNKTMLF